MNVTRYRTTDNIVGLMDAIFNDAFKAFGTWESQPSRFNKWVSSGSFPPTNIMVNKDTKVLTITAALAGIHEDWINLSWDGDSLKLVVDVPSKVEDQKEESPNVYLQLGLKKIEHLETSWQIDPRFFSREDINVNFLNGLLTIEIQPREDVKPKKQKLFGGLDVSKKENLITHEEKE